MENNEFELMSQTAQIGEIYTKVELTEQKVASLQDTMNNHVIDAKELAKEIRTMSDNVNNLVHAVNSTHQQSEESKVSIKDLETKVATLEQQQASYTTTINLFKWLIGASSTISAIIVSIISYVIQIKK